MNSLTGQELMWAFYGYSLGYSKFLGSVEMLGAGLLLFRRTVLLGCLVVTTALVNVIAQDIVHGVLVGALKAALLTDPHGHHHPPEPGTGGAGVEGVHLA